MMKSIAGIDYRKVDIFAYAMILYYVFTGVKPWVNLVSVSEIEEKVLKGDRPEFTKQIESNIKEIIINCWDPDPETRMPIDIVLERLAHET